MISNLSNDKEIESLRQLLSQCYELTDYRVHDQVIRLAYDIQNNVSDYQDYELYHLLVGGSTKGNCPHFDMSGRHSIREFIIRQHAKASKVQYRKLTSNRIYICDCQLEYAI